MQHSQKLVVAARMLAHAEARKNQAEAAYRRAHLERDNAISAYHKAQQAWFKASESERKKIARRG
jgi:hypothetical protein